MVEPAQPAQEEGESAEVQTEEQSLASQEAVIGVFQRLTEENPEGAVAAMRENLATAVEEERITPEFQRILNEVLDDVACVTPERQAQVFQEAVENNPELKDELANVLLLQDSAREQSSFLESGNPMAILFAVLSIVAGGGNTDFMSAMTDIMEEFGVPQEEIEEMREHIAGNDTEPTEPATTVPEEEAPADDRVVAQAETDGQEGQVAEHDDTTLRGVDFSGGDSEFQTEDPALREDAIAALGDIGVSTAGVADIGQMPAEQMEQTVTLELST